MDLPDFAICGALGAIMAVTSPDTWFGKTLAGSNVEQIVAHEFTHVVVNQLSGCRAPKWLNEGIAPIVAGQFSPSSRSRVIAESVRGGLYSLVEVDNYFQPVLPASVFAKVVRYCGLRPNYLLLMLSMTMPYAAAGGIICD